MYRENKPWPLAAMFFWRITIAWTILVEGHQGNISAKFFFEIGPVVSGKKIFKIFYTDIQRK